MARPFVIFMDHKHLTYVFQQRRDTSALQQFRHLEFIEQICTDFRHVSGQDSVDADTFSIANSVVTPIDYHALVCSQEQDADLQDILKNGSALRLERVPIPRTDVNLYFDTSYPQPRSFFTTPFRHRDFNTLHALSHPGANATVKLVSQ
jgi:hypothetical protein